MIRTRNTPARSRTHKHQPDSGHVALQPIHSTPHAITSVAGAIRLDVLYEKSSCNTEIWLQWIAGPYISLRPDCNFTCGITTAVLHYGRTPLRLLLLLLLQTLITSCILIRFTHRNLQFEALQTLYVVMSAQWTIINYVFPYVSIYMWVFARHRCIHKSDGHNGILEVSISSTKCGLQLWWRQIINWYPWWFFPWL